MHRYDSTHLILRNLIQSLFILQILQISGEAQTTHLHPYQHQSQDESVTHYQRQPYLPVPTGLNHLPLTNSHDYHEGDPWDESLPSPSQDREDAQVNNPGQDIWSLLNSLRPLEPLYPSNLEAREDPIRKLILSHQGREDGSSALPSDNYFKRPEKRWGWSKSRKSDLFKSRRFGRKRNQDGKLLFESLGPLDSVSVHEATEEELLDAAEAAKNAEIEKLRKAISLWETKLLRFAEKFSENPEVLNESPTWTRLVKVRNSLRALLAKLQFHSLDQTRM